MLSLPLIPIDIFAYHIHRGTGDNLPGFKIMITAHINIYFFSKSKVKNALPGKKNGLTPPEHGKIANEHNKQRVPEIFVCVFWASKKWDINP